MISRVVSGGSIIDVVEVEGRRFGMEHNSLSAHIQKHPEIAGTAEQYLARAAEIAIKGKEHDKGKLFKGFYTRTSESQELGLEMVHTVYQRYH